MVNKRSYKPTLIALTILFVALTIWWAWLFITGNVNNSAAYFFGATYGLVALVGGIFGLSSARSWGSFTSHIGKAIIFLSAGLLLAEFGQLIFSYFNIVEKVEVPYPSLADVGFFGAIPAYILGAYYLMRGLSIGTIVKNNPVKLVIGISIPLVVLAVCYWEFLKGYEAAGMGGLVVFLDFGYPLGQAIYVSIALVILLSLGKILGGVMKAPVFCLLFAFILQYAADFNFLFQSHRGTWANGGFGDYLYLSAYFLMGVSLVLLNRALAKGFTKSTGEGSS